jgi:hypothetical protein
MQCNTLIIIFFVLLIYFPADASAQADPAVFHEESLTINNRGMYVLGSWALTNMATGAVGWIKQTGASMYFHQMNFFWNSVNLSIAGLALFSGKNANSEGWDQKQFLDSQARFQRLYLINAGLDIGYMGAGLLMKKMAPEYPENQNRLKGYGNSVLLQGAFLFLFDIVMFGIQHNHQSDFLNQLSLTPMLEGHGITLSLNF